MPREIPRGVSRLKGVWSEGFARGASKRAGPLPSKQRTVSDARGAFFSPEAALCRGAMGIAGALWRMETTVASSVSVAIQPRRQAFWTDGSPSCALLQAPGRAAIPVARPTAGRKLCFPRREGRARPASGGWPPSSSIGLGLLGAGLRGFLGVVHPVLEAPNCLAQTLPHLGQLLRPKEKQRNHEDRKKVHRLKQAFAHLKLL